MGDPDEGADEMEVRRFKKSYDLLTVNLVVLFDLRVIWLTSGEFATYA